MPPMLYEDNKNRKNNKMKPLLTLVNDTTLLFCICIPCYWHFVSLLTIIALILLYSSNDNNGQYNDYNGNSDATKVRKGQQRTKYKMWCCCWFLIISNLWWTRIDISTMMYTNSIIRINNCQHIPAWVDLNLSHAAMVVFIRQKQW